MKIVVFAGGTGKRFWPVSRANAPKQFSPLIAGKPLLKLRVETLLKGFPAEDIFISTGKRYEEEVKKMLPEIPANNIIFEPQMRDTGPAVTLAVCYINKLFPNEAISIQWSDHIIKDETTFITTVKESEKVLNTKQQAVFLTVPARFPSPDRGYIKFGNSVQKISEHITLYNFEQFCEKPNVSTAESYIASGQFGWNPGYWTLSPNFYLQKIQALYPKMYQVCSQIVHSNFEQNALDEFSELDRISADYAFAENVKSDEAYVIWSDFGWSDVGEWLALKEALQTSDIANVTKGNIFDMDSKDSIIYNLEDSKLVSTIGLEGMVVVNTKDVVAVFPKKDNAKIKEYLKKLEEEGKDLYL